MFCSCMVRIILSTPPATPAAPISSSTTSMPVSLCAWFFIASISTEYSLIKRKSNGNSKLKFDYNYIRDYVV